MALVEVNGLKGKWIPALVATVLATGVDAAFAEGRIAVLKKSLVAASGRCLVAKAVAQMDSDPIEAYKIEIIDQSNGSLPLAETRANLRLALNSVTHLYGGVFAPFTRTRIYVAERSGHSRYKGRNKEGIATIEMNRCDSKGNKCADNNVAHLLHELGHQLGNSWANGQSYYQAYRRSAGNCEPTGYSKANANEQFAEVFAAYVAHPELLRQGDAACQRAYAFFSTDVFPKNGRESRCDVDVEPVKATPVRTEVAAAKTQIRVASKDVWWDSLPPKPANKRPAAKKPDARDVLDW